LEARSGKSKESCLPGFIATGSKPRLCSLPGTIEEAKKRYVGLLREGGPTVVIDTIERTLKDDALCSILTEIGMDGARTGLE